MNERGLRPIAGGGERGAQAGHPAADHAHIERMGFPM
jgi:hypothetical protein